MTPRRGILISALFFTPLAAGGCLFFLYLLVSALQDGGDVGDVFLLTVVGIVTLLLLFQALTAVLDLRSDLVNTEGLLTHKWSRSDFLVFGDSCYIRLARPAGSDGIFKIDRFFWEQFSVGDRLLVRHYPHTSAVETVEKL